MLKFTKKLVMVGVFAIALSMSSQAFAAKLTGLSFMGSYVDAHPTTINVFIPFIEKTKKFTNGEVTFDYFGSNVLYPDSEGYAVLNDGRVDFSVLRPAFFPGRMNLIKVIDLPYTVKNPVVGALVVSDLMNRSEILAEFPKSAVPFTAWTSAPYQIHTNKPVNSLADIKGLTLITWSASSFDFAKALGANPIRISPTDSYLSLSKSMADGVICPLAPVRSFKISEVTKYHYNLSMCAEVFNGFAFKALWDDFSPEQQKFFKDEGGAKFSLAVGKSLQDAVVADTEILKKQGHIFVEPSKADQDAMAKIFAPFHEKWVTSLPKNDQAKGRALLTYVKEREAHYQAEFEKGTYGKY